MAYDESFQQFKQKNGTINFSIAGAIQQNIKKLYLVYHAILIYLHGLLFYLKHMLKGYTNAPPLQPKYQPVLATPSAIKNHISWQPPIEL
ncbi:MAG: hypothetical protein JEZ07_01820 [Phycisphaerae bacterium]|nr:hypothetical protein [Phycisphaerae bacterium]